MAATRLIMDLKKGNKTIYRQHGVADSGLNFQ
jgi:hypothetical protein